jgi:hypothetical protein
MGNLDAMGKQRRRGDRHGFVRQDGLRIMRFITLPDITRLQARKNRSESTKILRINKEAEVSRTPVCSVGMFPDKDRERVVNLGAQRWDFSFGDFRERFVAYST